MALTFPSSPTNGQTYTDTTTGNRYIYNATVGVWSFSSNNVGMSVSSTPPSNVAPGAMWFNREIGRTFVYYDDGDSKQWIETVPAGTVDTNTIASYVNPVFASMNGAYTTANAGYVTANAGFGKANNALANTSGVSFNGTLNVPSGNMGIGTNSPNYSSFARALTLNGPAGVSSGFELAYNGTVVGNMRTDSGTYELRSQSTDLILNSNPSGSNNIIFKSGSNTERMRIDSSGYVTKPYQVAFGAYSAATGNYTTSANAVIPFTGGTRYNVGNGYSLSTSRFTAPIAGMYYFCFHAYNNGSGDRVNIRVNGGVSMGQGSRNGAGIDYHQAVIFYLSAGDYAEVWSTYGGGTVYLSSAHTEFAGYLLG